MNIFQHVTAPKVKRSTFNLSHDVRLTCDMGELVPFLCEEVIPGDTWKVNSNVLVRFAPLIAPVMHKINVYVHYWYVPFRLVWDEYQDFITGKGDEKTPPDPAPVFPTVQLLDGRSGSDYYDEDGLWAHGSLADYLGYPTSPEIRQGGGMNVSALPFRCYQLIYNEYYRDENLQEDLNISKSSGAMSAGTDEYIKLLTLRHRAWSKDYFTSALPFVQKGRTQPVPVNGQGIVRNADSLAVLLNTQNNPDAARVIIDDGGLLTNVGNVFADSQSSGGLPQPQNLRVDVDESQYLGVSGPASIYQPGQYVNPNGLRVALDNLGFTINDLRRSNAIQKWLERNARGGSRYIEMLLEHFGVISDDLQLQRPEFLGGGKTPVQIGDVLQTSQSTETSPQAEYAGVGFSNGVKNDFKRSFKERGYVIGILSVMPKPAYMEGLPVKYRKNDKFDFYFPEFAYLGEQPVYNYELALRGDNHQDVFGYAPRYAEYKYIPDRVMGDFKNLDGLGFWTLARHYSNQPALTSEFIECDPEENDLNRIFAVKDGDGDAVFDHLFVSIHNDVKARRPMPYLPDPSL